MGMELITGEGFGNKSLVAVSYEYIYMYLYQDQKWRDAVLGSSPVDMAVL